MGAVATFEFFFFNQQAFNKTRSQPCAGWLAFGELEFNKPGESELETWEAGTASCFHAAVGRSENEFDPHANYKTKHTRAHRFPPPPHTPAI